ncbi:hypothetical protein QL992_04095 [Microbacterium sp. APC 3898]|uniref:Uncharacterized protein n=2 Tax=Planococcus TaxID=1372 RepID=A0ABT7ZMK9_9BACL|nr:MULTISPECIES: hypothetical protein [Terrabacteria group]MBD8015195.1 hypothetical protein [Planococcus wigleyi]MDN3428083.1 hypothetical protein [Planococcus sp. APC 4016]MDN3498382.1 hypothetical protein [Microbacterium sp. APC 3898]
MKLLQVRKGQFVYYQNELHKVYSVKPLAKKSVLMFRIKDMEQVASKAEEVTFYKPKHMDSFLFFGARYTLHEDRPAEEGGYILITKPDPDYMDHYSLNEFEKVESVEGKNVITTRQNTVKSREFLVMVSGEEQGSNDIVYLDKSKVSAEQLEQDSQLEEVLREKNAVRPSIGDVYLNLDNTGTAMVVAIAGEEVTLGTGERITFHELYKADNWSYLYNINDGEFR